MSRNCIFSSVFLYLSIRYFSVSVATVITTNFLSFLDGFQWIATMKHARTNLTHFHCTKSTLTTYFHIFFFPLIARFLSLFFSFFLFLSSFSLRYNSLSFASYFPFLPFLSVFVPFFLSSQYLFLLFYLYTHVYRVYPIQYTPTPLRVPLFLSLNFLSLTPTINSMCLVHSQTMPRPFSRLRAIFAE